MNNWVNFVNSESLVESGGKMNLSWEKSVIKRN